jgi:FkbM family methyltransferase
MDYSQYGEQEFLLKFFENKTDGILVDIGAADGITNSNSRKLLEMGWSGLLVEPNTSNFEKLQITYSNNENIKMFNLGCSSESKKNSKFFIDKNDVYEQLSTFSEIQMENCKSYFNCEFVESTIDLIKTQELLEACFISHIDFLSVDTESYDHLVIEGIDFYKTNIKLICVEHVNQQIEKIFKENNYNLIHKTIGNSFYSKNI